MGKKLRTNFLSFSNEIEKLAKKIGFYNSKVIDLIYEKGNRFLISSPDKTATFVSDHSYSPISLRYSYESDRAVVTLPESILKDNNPIDLIKEKVINFQEKSLQVVLLRS